jgi:hypothetical protein
VSAMERSMNWDLRSPQGQLCSDGVYIWDVEVRDASNRPVERIVRKVAVLRR